MDKCRRPYPASGAFAQLKFHFDGIRYTAVFDEGNFTDSYNEVVKALEDKGIQHVRCKIFFKDFQEGNSDQKAVQDLFRCPDGTILELQFHTTDSLAVKNGVNHALYETSRLPQYKDTVGVEILRGRMQNMGKEVKDPDSVEDIESFEDPSVTAAKLQLESYRARLEKFLSRLDNLS